jgi:hypothetical protein
MTTSSAASRRAALIEPFTAPGQPSRMGERTVRGVTMRVYTTGPLPRTQSSKVLKGDLRSAIASELRDG